MTLETLRLLRNILLRSFAVGFILYLASWLMMMAAYDFWLGFAASWTHMTNTELNRVMVDSFAQIKIFLMFGLLVPGLGVHWTLRKEMKKA